jgi:hypothetical protein
MAHDYIPKNDDELLVFAEHLYAYAPANYTRRQVPSPQSFLEAPVAAYKTTLTTYQDPNHGKIDTITKNETKRPWTPPCVPTFKALSPGIPPLRTRIGSGWGFPCGTPFPPPARSRT